MRDGWGIQVWPDGAKYEGMVYHNLNDSILTNIIIGEWRNNKAHGKGKFWHIDGDIFEGNS